MSFENDLHNLKRLFADSEQELKKFNEIIPYEHNPVKIYSPKLVNLLLQIGPQIESLTDLIATKKALGFERGGVPARIERINHDSVLSRFEIIFKINGALITPFTLKQKWWTTYNETKHNLAQSQFDITSQSVLDALAALAALHRLADVISKTDEDNLEYILEKQYWRKAFWHQSNDAETSRRIRATTSETWNSMLFTISNYFVYSPYN